LAGGYISHTTNDLESLSDFSRPWNKNTLKAQTARKKNPTQSQPKHLQNYEELTSTNTTQRHTDSATHPRQIRQRAHTGQTGAPLTRGKTRRIKRNQRNPAKNSSNPRTLETPKSSPFAHRFGRGIKGKRTMKGSCIHPPPNPKEKGLEIAPRKSPRKSPRKGSENHQKKQMGTTHPSLEEPRQIIYTSQRGSYKV
jgi:hypothetical protein